MGLALIVWGNGWNTKKLVVTTHERKVLGSKKRTLGYKHKVEKDTTERDKRFSLREVKEHNKSHFRTLGSNQDRDHSYRTTQIVTDWYVAGCRFWGGYVNRKNEKLKR